MNQSLKRKRVGQFWFLGRRVQNIGYLFRYFSFLQLIFSHAHVIFESPFIHQGVLALEISGNLV